MNITILNDSDRPFGFGVGLEAERRRQECAELWLLTGIPVGRFNDLDQAESLAASIANRVCVARDDTAGGYVVLSRAA